MSRARDERAALRAETTDLLQDLGPTADAVAVRLESAGVKGVPGSGTGCAVARYINAVMASDPRLGPITVSNEAVTLLGRHWWSPPVIVAVPLSGAELHCSIRSRGLRQLTELKSKNDLTVVLTSFYNGEINVIKS